MNRLAGLQICGILMANDIKIRMDDINVLLYCRIFSWLNKYSRCRCFMIDCSPTYPSIPKMFIQQQLKVWFVSSVLLFLTDEFSLWNCHVSRGVRISVNASFARKNCRLFLITRFWTRVNCKNRAQIESTSSKHLIDFDFRFWKRFRVIAQRSLTPSLFEFLEFFPPLLGSSKLFR